MWNRFPEYAACYRGFANGPHYRYALAGAGVVLCPVRRANRDGHSMRTFEAPAAGAFTLMERTPDHLELFEEERHAAFFEGPDELRDKTDFYLGRDDAGRPYVFRQARADFAAGVSRAGLSATTCPLGSHAPMNGCCVARGQAVRMLLA